MAARLTDRDLLARLVAFDSTSRNSNLPIADFVCDYLAQAGAHLTRNPSPDGTKTNVIARIEGREAGSSGRRGLVLCGHMDVVPAGEPEWRNDPFTLTDTHDAYVGRGACDMKGFVALAMNMAVNVAAQPPRYPLVLVLTYDEEVGSRGAERLVRTWTHPSELPTSTIVGEPTSLRLVRTHKGLVSLRLAFRGKSAHSGYPRLGVSAVEPAARVISALSELRVALEAKQNENGVFFPDAPFAALNVARVRGGEAENIIPDRCDVDLTLRLLPGMNAADLIAQVREAMESVEQRGDCTLELRYENPPMMLAENSATNRRLCDLLLQHETVGACYATDAGFLQQMGLECVLWGPGNIEVAHKPNESIPKDQFAQARKTLERIVNAFCQ